MAAAHEIPDFAELFLLVRFGKKLSRFLSVAPTANYPDMNGKFFAQLSSAQFPRISLIVNRKRRENEWAPFSETGLNDGKVEQPFS